MAAQGQGTRKFHNRNELFSVFVGRLNIDVKEKDVFDLFSGCGEVVDHVILPPKAGTTHKYGFIRYLHRDEAFRAMKELNGWALKSERIIVDVAAECASRFSSGCIPEDLSAPSLDLENNGSQAQTSQRSPHLDSIINLNRVKEICLWVNSELAGTCSTGIVKTERIIKDLDSKGGASNFPATFLKPSGRTALTLTSMLAELEKGEDTSSKPSMLSQKVWDSYQEISSKVVELLNDKSLAQGLTKLSERSKRKAGLVDHETHEDKSTDHSENLPGLNNSLLSTSKPKRVHSKSNPMASNILPQSPSKSVPYPPNSIHSNYSLLQSLQQQGSSSSLASGPFQSSKNSATPTYSDQGHDDHTKTLSSFHEQQSRCKPPVPFSPCHEQSRCKPSVPFSPCHEQSRCKPPVPFSPCHEQSRCKPSVPFSPCHEQSRCKPSVSFSPCHEQSKSKSPYSSNPEHIKSSDTFMIPKIGKSKQKEVHGSLPPTTNINNIEDLDSLLTVGQKLQEKTRLELSKLECSIDKGTGLFDIKEDQSFAEQKWENLGKLEFEDHDEFASKLFCEILDLENDSNPAYRNDIDKAGFHQQTTIQKLKIQAQNSTSKPLSDNEKNPETLSQTSPETPQAITSDTHTKTNNSVNHSSVSTHLFQSSNYHELLLNKKMESNQLICSSLPTKKPAIAIVRPNSASVLESHSKEVDNKPSGFRASRLACLSRFSTPKPGVNIKPPFTAGQRKRFSSDGDSFLSSSSSNTSLSSPR